MRPEVYSPFQVQCRGEASVTKASHVTGRADAHYVGMMHRMGYQTDA